jgi:hypothetical protein
MGIDDVEKRVPLFIHYVYYTALAHGGDLSSIEKYIKQRDPLLMKTQVLWDGLSNFFNKRRMLHNLFHLNYEIRNHYEDAAFAALELFDEESSMSLRVSHLSHAQYCLYEAVHYRTNPQEKIVPPFQCRKSQTLPSIQRLLELTSFLQSTVQYCLESRVPFTSEYNILKGKEQVISLGAMLMSIGADERVAKLCALGKIEVGVVLKRLYQNMCELPVPELLSGIKKNRGRWGSERCSELLKCAALGKAPGSILVLISICWADPHEQCLRFIEYGYFTEAFSHAMAFSMKPLIPLIAYKAAMLGDAEIVGNCQKILG